MWSVPLPLLPFLCPLPAFLLLFRLLLHRDIFLRRKSGLFLELLEKHGAALEARSGKKRVAVQRILVQFNQVQHVLDTKLRNQRIKIHLKLFIDKPGEHVMDVIRFRKDRDVRATTENEQLPNINAVSYTHLTLPTN